MKRYPFKFLDAYNQEDYDIFFGRDEEIQALYEMIFQADLLLVYGASGTGKTSLIQCGLASKFQSHDWLALNIRRGTNINTSLEKALYDAGASQLKNDENLDWLEEDWSNSKTDTITKLSPLGRSLKDVYLKYFKPIYLIFDQFEELYTLGNQEKKGDNKTEEGEFIATIKEILQVDQPVKIIISIREEYLGHLYEFERQVPELFRKKLRVEAMNLDKVKTVIKSVDGLKNGNVHLKKGEEDQIAENIFNKLKGKEKSLGIQLPYLQVFLDKFYLQVTGNDDTRQAEALFTISALNEMGNIGDVLRNFLDGQVSQTANSLGQKPETIWKILSPFVTLEGTKEPISEKGLMERLVILDPKLIEDSLRIFSNQGRILRYIERNGMYEIAHDSLAKQIHNKRSDEEIATLEVRRLIKSQVSLKLEAREFFTEKQLLFIEPFLEKFKANEEEKEWIRQSESHLKVIKQRQEDELVKAKKSLMILRTLAFVMVFALAAAWHYYEKAYDEKKQALQEKERAEKMVLANQIIARKKLPVQFDALIPLDTLDVKGWRVDSLSSEIGKLVNLTSLNLSNNNLKELPTEIGQLENLTSLDIFGNNLKELPTEIGQLENLTSLDFSRNNLGRLPAEILQLKNLTVLDLSYNSLWRLPAEILQLKNLTALDLNNNALTYLPAEIGQLENLTSLNLRRNELGKLPAQLENLTSLDLSYNNLTELPAEIGQLENLTSLDLRNTNLTELPAEIGHLKNLTSLDLRSNRLTELPAEIGQLKNLTSLDLRSNKLTELPAEIGQLENLTSLDLKNDDIFYGKNHLIALPAEIGQLENLTSLDLRSNKLTKLPAEIGQLKNLTSLILKKNELTKLPAEIGQLENLTSLNLSYNRRLTYLPAEIGRLENLAHLYLGFTNLRDLPAEIGQLENLAHLYLSGTNMKELPAEIGQLENLTHLVLQSINLRELPAEIGQLKNLTYLHLNNTNLRELPAEIGQLENLTHLYLSSTNLKEFPAEIYQLENLNYLELSFTNLKELPAEIGQLKNLTSLVLRNNNLTKLPTEIIQLENLIYLDLTENLISEAEKEKIYQLFPYSNILF